MAAIVPTSELTFGQKVGQNLESALRSGSTWVVLIGGSIVAALMALTEEQKATLFQLFPVLQGYWPMLMVICTWAVTRLRPSGKVSSATQAVVDELVQRRVNDWLAQQGKPTLRVEAVPLPATPTSGKVLLPVTPPPWAQTIQAVRQEVDLPLPLQQTANVGRDIEAKQISQQIDDFYRRYPKGV